MGVVMENENRELLLDSAAHWDRLACDHERLAAYYAGRGEYAGVELNKADAYRKAAESLRREADGRRAATGATFMHVPHPAHAAASGGLMSAVFLLDPLGDLAARGEPHVVKFLGVLDAFLDDPGAERPAIKSGVNGRAHAEASTIWQHKRTEERDTLALFF